jgi:hypothetical protein
VPEGQLTEEELARMQRGFELFNAGDHDALRDFVSPDIVMERVGDLPPIHGWEAFRALQEPDAFEWQTVEPLEWQVNGQKLLIRVRIRSKGAASGVVIDMQGWMVWTYRDGLVVHMINAQDEERALEAIRAPA